VNDEKKIQLGPLGSGNAFPVWRVLFTLIFFALTAPLEAGVDYLKELKPLLKERCYTCHGALKQKNRLRLDTVELMLKGGKSGPAVLRGKPDESLALQRVTASDLDERMPPQHEGEPFTVAQVALLREWIATGAPAPVDERAESDPKEHWAFRPRVRPPVPAAANAKWVRNPIDAFIAKEHDDHGLAPQPEASRAILLRRLYLDLIGLPPSLQELAAFENDPSPDWYERVVKQLLDDPRHGERWARHWMDIWRYSDWWGLGDQLRNSQKHIWHWRDWIVESLNADLPYDEMIRLMLAADESHPNDLKKLRATGFLARNWFLFNRNQWMDETVEHVSKGFLGLTVNCAKCHDHKYDPISQVDYYRMRAFFEPYHVRMDVVPGEPDLTRDGIPRAFDGLLDTPTYRFVRGDENQPDKSAIIAPGVPELLAFTQLKVQPIVLPPEAWQPERRAWVIDAHRTAAQKKVEVAGKALATAREQLATAQKRESEIAETPSVSDAKPTPPAEARTTTASARAEVTVAELALTMATTELMTIDSRRAAMGAAWARAAADSSQTNTALAELERDATSSAIRAEREAAVAKARHAVAVAEMRLTDAAGSKKDAIKKELKTARETLDQATQSVTAPITETDKFAPLYGAQWTPTRFFNSQKDDPAVEFGPKSSGRRTALAGWITDPRNPLTARVAANHLWARHMGAPLVPAVFDFGRKEGSPTHSDLLDWLASELVDSGWSMKHLHQLIVTSAAYRMSSSVADGESNLAKDPDNMLWWRRTPIRIEAEAVRDSILALAGQLDPTIGGPSVPTDSQTDSKRRSLYFFHSNNERNLFLTTFDEANVKECYRREQSIVPQQALALSNSRLVQDCTKLIAARFGADVSPGDDPAFVRKAFRGVLGFAPQEAELAASVETMEAWRKIPDTTPDQARAHFVWALLNHNDFVTMR